MSTLRTVFFLTAGTIAAFAAGPPTEAALKAMFPPGTEVLHRATLQAPGGPYMGAEVTVRFPYTEKISQGTLDAEVTFTFRRKVTPELREHVLPIIQDLYRRFSKGECNLEGGDLSFDEPGTEETMEEMTGTRGSKVIEKHAKAAAAPGIVWYQLTEERLAGRTQKTYNCYYGALVGDFVAEMKADVPDSRAKADAWFAALVAACN